METTRLLLDYAMRTIDERMSVKEELLQLLAKEELLVQTLPLMKNRRSLVFMVV